ncbi:MAG TPA: hypothetical protein VEO36_02845 [Casimicrobiaceae bacterium]|nr:hypothetical protein [Casimicrobiaceae bacterium]
MNQSRRLRSRGRILALASALLLLSPLTANVAKAVSDCTPGPGDRPELGLQGSVLIEERTAPGGFQGHWCGARLVGAHNLFDRGSYGDTQLIRHCAYSSMRDPSDLTKPTTGVVVMDVSVPSQPKDIQVLRTPAMLRAYSAFEIQGNTMIGAYKDFGPNGTNPLDIYDVSGDCLHPKYLSTINVASGNHDGWLTPDTNTYYGIPFGGARLQVNATRADVHVTDLADKSNPKPLMTWNRLQLPADVQTRTNGATNFHDISTNDKGTRLYMALYGGLNSLGGNNSDPNQRCANGLLILDSTDIALRRPNPQLRYINYLSWCDQQLDPDFGDRSTASAHATEYVIHENGKEYIVTTDESGGGLNGDAAGVCAQHTYARIIDISDELHPKVVGTFKPDVNKPENCAANLAAGTTGGMVHYIGFDDRYHMRLVIYAGANQGMRIVDFRDPTNPKEIAYYNAPRHTTTPANGQDFTRPDPRYDTANCMIYTGWNQGGLKIIELTNPDYNPCMRRTANGGGFMGNGKNKINVSVDAKRTDSGLEGGVTLNDHDSNAKIVIDKLTFLGSVRDACGSVPAEANSMQFNGTGTFNGASASFRICVQDNHQGNKGTEPDQFHLACTEGCNYSAGGAINGGNVQVRQQ